MPTLVEMAHPTGPEPAAFAFGVLVVGLLSSVSIWIMDHLAHEAMAMTDAMQHFR